MNSENPKASPSGEKPFVPEDVVEQLDDMDAKFRYMESADSFVSIGIAERVYLCIDPKGLALRLTVDLGAVDNSADGPKPEDVFENLGRIVGLTPTMIALGFRREGWKVFENVHYDIEFRKAIDIYDVALLRQEVRALADFFSPYGLH